MLTRLPLAIALSFACAAAASAGPLRTLADLQAVRVWEITFSTIATDFAPTDIALTTRLADPLGAANRDISFTTNEYYDVFLSNADGTPNPDGAFLTIEGVWRSPGGPGGMNINEVALVFGSSPTTPVFANFVASFEYGIGSVTVGSEALAVDGNLSTFPRFGTTSAVDLADRFRLTVGWNAYSVPEPSSAALFAFGSAGLAALGRARRRRGR